MTSPLRALRLSGRLMVIQNAWPRLSRITLLSVMVLPARCSREETFAAGARATARAFTASGRLPRPHHADAQTTESPFPQEGNGLIDRDAIANETRVRGLHRRAVRHVGKASALQRDAAVIWARQDEHRRDRIYGPNPRDDADRIVRRRQRS